MVVQSCRIRFTSFWVQKRWLRLEFQQCDHSQLKGVAHPRAHLAQGPTPAQAQTWPEHKAQAGQAKSWNLEIQKFGVQTQLKMKILKIQIHHAQNVGKLWIGWEKKHSRPHCMPFEPMFPCGNTNAIFFGGWPNFLGGSWVEQICDHIWTCWVCCTCC